MNNINTSTLDSREIAEMLEISHWQILRKLEGIKGKKGILEILGDNNFVVTDYFIKSTYLSEQNKEMPCYQFTKMGCEFIANKFTGEKGIIFTAKYVKRFNDMEQSNFHTVQPVLLPEQKELNKDMKEAYKQAKFISNIMENAGASAESKLNAINKIYASVGIDLLEDKPIYKNVTDLEFDMLFQEIVNMFTKMHNIECQNYIINIKNDDSIDNNLKKNLLSFYLCAYKTVIKNKLRIL